MRPVATLPQPNTQSTYTYFALDFMLLQLRTPDQSPFTVGKLRLWEVKWLAQDHTANWQQGWYLSPSLPILSLMLYHVACSKFRIKHFCFKTQHISSENTTSFFISLNSYQIPLYFCPGKDKMDFPGGLDDKESACNAGGPRFNPWVRKIPWRKEWLPTPVFLPGELHGPSSLEGYNPWGRQESDMTECLTPWLRTRWGYLGCVWWVAMNKPPSC